MSNNNKEKNFKNQMRYYGIKAVLSHIRFDLNEIEILLKFNSDYTYINM